MTMPGPYRPYQPPRPPRNNTARNIILGIGGGVLTVVVIVVVVLLAGGGDSGPTADQADSSGQDTNERGNIPVEIGEPVDLTDVNGAVVAHMTVTEINVDGTDPGPGDFEGDHIIGIHVTVETTAAASNAFTITGMAGWSVINGETGKTVEVKVGYGDGVPQLGPSQSADGVIILHAPAPTGTLIYSGPTAFVSEPSYEWQF